MIKQIFRIDRENWACGLTVCDEIFVGTITSGGSLDYIEWFLPNTHENRIKAEKYWKDRNFAREIRTVGSSEAYGDFLIVKTAKGFAIQNLNGQELRVCRTKKECKNRIDTQTV